MEDENEILKRRVEELETSLASLEGRMCAFEAERELPTSLGAAIHHSSHPPVPTPRPFEVNYDPDAEGYYIFAPPGCVLVNGVAVEIKDVDLSDHTVALDLDPEDLPDCLWAHVTEDEDAEGGYIVEFDDEEENEDAKWNFRVMRFGAAENDGNQYDLCASIVCLGGEGLIRHFNISGGKVCNCRIYAPDTELTCGDYTIDTTKGDIYVHVDRTDSSGAGSSYTLSVDQDGTRALSSTHAKWLLYVYEDGKVKLDCRPGVLPVFSLS